MRVRIIRPPSEESVDGVDVSAFRVGRVYSIPMALATLMIVERWAEPLIDDGDATLPPITFQLPTLIRERRRRQRGGARFDPGLGIAADRRRKT